MATFTITTAQNIDAQAGKTGGDIYNINGGSSYNFRKIINGNSATLEQIYTKIQYLLRQNSDIDSGAASAGDDAPITIVAGNNGSAKPVVATGTISRTKGISISLVAEQDRAFV